MGNACCAEESDRKMYDPTLKRNVDFDPSASRITTIKFPPANVPIKNPVVSELNNEAGIFTAHNPNKTSGTLAEPKLLNKQGLVYKGEWQGGIPHGKGELFYPNGAYYVGYFCKGNADGQGRFISPEGWIYDGELENQQAQGRGILYHKGLKYKFQGMWSGDLPNGHGKEEWQSKGTVYQGQFLNGKKHGQGKYVTQQYEYQGNFNNDQFDSYGCIKYKSGEKYQGNFEHGKKHGKGVSTWPDGSCYEGSYKDDLKHGQGRYKSYDQSYFEGEWANGKREGHGTLFVGTKKYTAQWVNNIPLNTTNNRSNMSAGRVSRLSVQTMRR